MVYEERQGMRKLRLIPSFIALSKNQLRILENSVLSGFAADDLEYNLARLEINLRDCLTPDEEFLAKYSGVYPQEWRHLNSIKKKITQELANRALLGGSNGDV